MKHFCEVVEECGLLPITTTMTDTPVSVKGKSNIYLIKDPKKIIF